MLRIYKKILKFSRECAIILLHSPRLQRRADFLILCPFSLPELLAHRGLISLDFTGLFYRIIESKTLAAIEKIIDMDISTDDQIRTEVGNYLIFGGLPLPYLSSGEESKLVEIRKIVERGFESISIDNEAVSDAIKIELALLHSKEFTYQGLFQKTGIRRRDLINKVIDQLINQGYLLKKKPFLEEVERRSYLTVFTYYRSGNSNISHRFQRH